MNCADNTGHYHDDRFDDDDGDTDADDNHYDEDDGLPCWGYHELCMILCAHTGYYGV